MGSSTRASAGFLTVEVRKAARADIPAIVAIEQRSFGDPWSARSFDPLIGAGNTVFLVAEEGGRIQGYAVALAIGEEGEILNVAVDPAGRGSGLGGRLLDDALARLRESGVRAVYLEVRDANAAARSLYARRGFLETGRRRNYYRNPTEDALVLLCRLEA